MGKTIKKTHQEFIEEMKIKHPYLEITGVYLNSSSRISYICKKCGLHWSAKAAKLSLGRGCPQCAGNKRKTTQEFIEEVYKINPNVKVLSEYKRTSNKVLFECKKCGYKWEAFPGSVLKGKGCMLCGKESMANKLRKTHEVFKNEIFLINDNIELISEYKGQKNKIWCKCKKCGYEWRTFPTTLLGRHGCPNCSLSKGEEEISIYLDGNNIKYETQKRFENLKGVGGNLLSYDFYIPSLNLLIEYQGEQHKKPIDYFGGIETFERQKIHDKLKREYAIKNNYIFLEIWYYEDLKKKLEQTLNSITVTTAGC
jgi:predicted  nucleic acid-binding Zn-ribbon protein